MALEGILKSIRKYGAIAAVTVLTSCESCGNDQLKEVDYCQIPENFSKPEICNNNFDDNCDGLYDEGCDEDLDGYCTSQLDVIASSSTAASVCARTFEHCLDTECINLHYDCDDFSASIHPQAIELCDNLDNNCEGTIDESFPEFDSECYGPLPNDVFTGGDSICALGKYKFCIQGEKVCVGYIPPTEEKCALKDENCDGKVNPEGFLTEARECYYNETQSLPLNHPSVYPLSKGICHKGIEFCTDGIVGGDGVCYGAVLPKEHEECNCLDETCEGEIDEGVRNYELLQIAVGVDMSPSMEEEMFSVWENFSSLDVPPCSTNVLQMSTIAIGERSVYPEPTVKRSLVSLEEFTQKFSQDIPHTDGAWEEPTLNTIVYTACALIDQPPQQAHPYCDLIRPYNSLNDDPAKPVFTPGAHYVLVLASDEPGQWINPTNSSNPDFPYFDVQQVAEVAAAAGLELIIFTNLEYATSDLTPIEIGPFEGYGYTWGHFVDVGIATIEDLEAPNLGQRIEQRIFDFYCPGRKSNE